MEDPTTHLYRANQRDELFEVLDASDNVILVCQDEASATNYVVLLSEAHQRGYKMGYCDGKKLAIRARQK
jgi:hypothetical protein